MSEIDYEIRVQCRENIYRRTVEVRKLLSLNPDSVVEEAIELSNFYPEAAVGVYKDDKIWNVYKNGSVNNRLKTSFTRAGNRAIGEDSLEWESVSYCLEEDAMWEVFLSGEIDRDGYVLHKYFSGKLAQKRCKLLSQLKDHDCDILLRRHGSVRAIYRNGKLIKDNLYPFKNSDEMLQRFDDSCRRIWNHVL